jgi:putative ABC transport system ATP-binding protein
MSLILKDVRKSFVQGGQNIQVLKGLNAKIEDGEIVAVVGQSGSGKSTLLSLLSGLDSPTSGTVTVNNQDLTRLNQDETTLFRARHIGIVFQQFHLMAHLTALENVTLPLEILGQANVEARAKQMLGLMELSHRLSHFPSQMSGGECQRVAMARALVVEPSILLADEPSGNLDVETGSRVMAAFFEAIRKTKVTTVLVTHSEALARQCDRQLILKNGVL